MNKNTKKAIDYLSKLKTKDEIVEAYEAAKATLTGMLMSMQEEVEKQANQLQETIEKFK